uniref:GG12478 n=1 Tax=Drosophila erecta TaxID=7220 RepID=B3P8I9_DROER
MSKKTGSQTLGKTIKFKVIFPGNDKELVDLARATIAVQLHGDLATIIRCGVVVAFTRCLENLHSFSRVECSGVECSGVDGQSGWTAFG